MLSRCFLDFSVGVGAYVRSLPFSLVHFMLSLNKHVLGV